MKTPPPDNPDSRTASDAMRAALERQLRETTAAETVCAPPSVADHTLLHRIGRGAYGEVWLARNALGTLRAVKVVYRARFEEDRPYEREFNGILKYEPVSRSHEGLVQVLHVGRDDEAGCFYYVMEVADAEEEEREPGGKRAEGQSTTINPVLAFPLSPPPPFASAHYRPRTLRSELARRQRLPPVDAAQLAVRLAGALAHLHGQGLVHRDIKPSNVIFVGGQPKLADIGLVTNVGSSQSFVGTEGFIPPEGPGTPQADLYGLGKLLYELATGRDRMDFPQLPPRSFTRSPSDGERDRVRGADGEALLELNEVMTRACAPEPKQRYATATELGADLNLFLAGRSLRRARNIERHIAVLKRVAVIACGCLVVAATIVWLALNEKRHANQRASAEAALRQRAEAAERETGRQLYAALLEQGRANVRSGELGQRVKALDAVRRAAAISNSAALRGVALAAHALPDMRFERELPYGSEYTMRLVDPSFERIALCRDRGPVEIRSTSDQRLLATLPASTNLPAYFSEWSADGRFLAVSRNHDSGVTRTDKEVWSVADARRRLLLRDVPYDSMCFHPQLPRLLIGRRNAAEVWDVENGAEVGRISLQGTPRWLRFAPDGERIAASYAAERDWIVAVHRLATGELLASNDFDKTVVWFNWHPSGDWLAVPDHGGAVHWMDANTGEKRLLGRHKAEATRTEFSPDGAYLLSGGWDRELICWDARTLKRSLTIGLNGYAGRFRADGRAYALETPSGLQLHAFERAGGHREFAEDLGSRLTQAAFSPDGRWLAAAGTDQLGVWDLQNGRRGALATNAGATRVRFAANGELFADHPGAGYRWQVSAGTNAESPPQLTRLAFAQPEGFTSLCTVSNDIVLTGARGSAVVDPGELGAAASRNWKRTVAGLSGASPDGRWLALYPSFTSFLFVHRLPGLGRLAILTNASGIHGFQFSPAGDEIAVCCRSEVEFWSTATWQRARTLTRFNNQLYSPDGRTMWLTEQFRTGGLYDARTFELLLPLPIGTFPLAVSPDGRRLAVSVDLRRLQVWDLVEVRQQLGKLGLDWPEK